MADSTLSTPLTDALAKAVRRHPEIKQGDLAALLGKTQGTVSNYFNGKSVPSESDAEKLSKHFGIDLMPAWREAFRQSKAQQSRNRQSGWVERKKQPLQTLTAESEEYIRKLDALPAKEREKIKRLVDEAFRKHFGDGRDTQGTLQENTHRQLAPPVVNLDPVHIVESDGNSPRTQPPGIETNKGKPFEELPGKNEAAPNPKNETKPRRKRK